MNFKLFFESTNSIIVLRRATEEDLKKVYDFGYTWSTEEHVDRAYIVDIKKDEELTPGIKLVVEFKKKNPLELYTVYDYNEQLGRVKFINNGPLVDAIKNWEFKQTLSPSTAKQFNELIDEL